MPLHDLARCILQDALARYSDLAVRLGTTVACKFGSPICTHLGEINIVAKALQRRGLSLEGCRYFLDTLTTTILKQRDNPNAPFYKCSLNDDYIKLHSRHSPSSVFESGVIKIQRGEYDAMSVQEQEACADLKIPFPETGEDSELPSDEEEPMSMCDIIRQPKRQRREPHQPYMNSQFILGSSAEIERLFSIAGGILADNRQGLTPLLFESLLFLKVNRKYWDMRTVITAMGNSQSTLVRERVAEDAEQQILNDL